MNKIRISFLWATVLFGLLGCAEEEPYQLSAAAEAYEKTGLYDIDKLAADYLNPNITYGEFKDERDGRVYKTIEYIKDTILAQNLAFADSEMAIFQRTAKRVDAFTHIVPHRRLAPRDGIFFGRPLLGLTGTALSGIGLNLLRAGIRAETALTRLDLPFCLQE